MITKRPCGNCPFRNDEARIELCPGRLAGIVADLKADDMQTFVCHKTLDAEPQTCAGAVAIMSKLGQLPVIARIGLIHGIITMEDIEASAKLVIDPASLARVPAEEAKLRKRIGTNLLTVRKVNQIGRMRDV